MIKFFRAIRRRLIIKDKMYKYTAYAIGEIFLVVIGILIALQVNNWNTSKKEKKFEINILSEIKTSLEGDLNVLQYGMLSRVDTKKKALQEVLEMRNTGQSYPDSLILVKYNTINSGLSLGINQGPYETLKSVGLDKISNDPIRSLLSEVYDVEVPRILGIIEFMDEEQGNAIEKMRLHNSLWKRVQIRQADNSWKIVSKPLHDNILHTSTFLDRIKIEQDLANIYTFWINMLSDLLEDAILEIEKELSRLRAT